MKIIYWPQLRELYWLTEPNVNPRTAFKQYKVIAVETKMDWPFYDRRQGTSKLRTAFWTYCWQKFKYKSIVRPSKIQMVIYTTSSTLWERYIVHFQAVLAILKYMRTWSLKHESNVKEPKYKLRLFTIFSKMFPENWVGK